MSQAGALATAAQPKRGRLTQTLLVGRLANGNDLASVICPSLRTQGFQSSQCSACVLMLYSQPVNSLWEAASS